MIEAAREFVCIRTATYESAEEAKYLEGIFRGREGTLENTVFLVMSPDGTKRLTRSGRGPQWEWNDASAMAAGLRKIASEYQPTGKPLGIPALRDFRVSLNVAACDSLPLVAAVGASPEEAKAASSALENLAWKEDLRGRLSFAPPSTTRELAAAGMGDKPGIVFVEPDAYGQTGRVVARLPLTSGIEEIQRVAQAILAEFKTPAKDARTHIFEGRRRGVNWKTAIPVTDPNGRGGG